MLSSEDLETLIASKKREIEREKTLLGLSLPHSDYNAEDNKENSLPDKPKKQVIFSENNEQQELPNKQVNFKKRGILRERQQNGMSTETEENVETCSKVEDRIPPDLERYIRRYTGIPAMLKAGEYSPNNPLLREAGGGGGDAFRGLGDYERRRNTLRRHRQAQYREYLDQQAKKKQEAKEQAERERREREERESQREERERQLLLERERYTPERRASVTSAVNNTSHTTKVDTGVQVDGLSRPLSVAVQTDDIELYRLSPSTYKCLTEAERELSPRTAADACDKWGERRGSHGDYDERTATIKKTNREKLVSDLRHSYMPSIFDADAIHMRNLQAEKEAAARRQFYQQELKNQIMEQQRIREERKSREKMLEQAEMRRLEEQLRMLRMAQEREIDKQHDISAAMKDSSKEYNAKRTELQKEIDFEQQKLLRATSQPARNLPKRYTNTSQSDTPRSKLPFYYPSEKNYQQNDKDKKPYSFNIPDNSVFSSNYDVDSYLRKNLNFRDKMELNIENIGNNKHVERSKDADRNKDYERSKDVETNKDYGRNKDVETNKDYGRNKDVESNKDYGRSKDVETNKDYGRNKDVETNNGFGRNRDFENNKDIEKSTDVKRNNFNKIGDNERNRNVERNINAERNMNAERNVIVEKALIHEYREKPQENTRNNDDIDSISIPVLRHSPKTAQINKESPTNISDAMKKVEDKWKVPAVQKNILKFLPNEEGKNVSILTQLGSIRRQLQLEQLKLDKMLSHDEV